MTGQEGAWIFLSHSNKDWNEVRRIRNLLEEKRHKPLLFFLKCLDDESELDGLIKREIEARSWFLLCDSKNARESKWVQDEVSYIKELKGKYYELLDLNSSIEEQIERIDILSKRVTVFLSYAHADQHIAVRMREGLLKHDYSVWNDYDISPGINFIQEIASTIDEAVQRGFVLVLLSQRSLQSQSVKAAIQYSIEKASKSPNRANIIPIMIDAPQSIQGTMPPSLQLLLGGLQWANFSKGDLDQNVKKLVAKMKTRTME